MAQVITAPRVPAAPRLAPGEVHVWHVGLAGAASPAAIACLADGEVSRASRFAFERDRRRYVRARSALRALLGRYLGLLPAEVPISYGRHGKPRVAARVPLEFNVTHSGERALIAVCRHAALGVDIEMVDRSRPIADLARDVFTDAEIGELEAAPGDAAIAFHACWSRKEAFLKALGLGLTLAPREVHVGTRPDRRHVPSSASARIEVATLFADETAAAAIAVVGGFTEATRLEA
jgi:4'-phosphopantetheinyl transferase